MYDVCKNSHHKYTKFTFRVVFEIIVSVMRYRKNSNLKISVNSVPKYNILC